MTSGLPAVAGLGSWPMVRPHCISSSVRSPSHRVPVNSDESSRLKGMSVTMVELAGEVVDALVGGDDVVLLRVEVPDELVESLYQGSQVVFSASEGGAEGLGDFLDLDEPAPVEEHRRRCQRLLGGRVGARMRQR